VVSWGPGLGNLVTPAWEDAGMAMQATPAQAAVVEALRTLGFVPVGPTPLGDPVKLNVTDGTFDHIKTLVGKTIAVDTQGEVTVQP
jgi:hypothetical protein